MLSLLFVVYFWDLARYFCLFHLVLLSASLRWFRIDPIVPRSKNLEVGFVAVVFVATSASYHRKMENGMAELHGSLLVVLG